MSLRQPAQPKTLIIQQGQMIFRQALANILQRTCLPILSHQRIRQKISTFLKFLTVLTYLSSSSSLWKSRIMPLYEDFSIAPKGPSLKSLDLQRPMCDFWGCSRNHSNFSQVRSFISLICTICWFIPSKYLH